MLPLNDEAAFILVCILLDDIRQVHVSGVLHILDVTDVVQIVFKIGLFNLWLRKKSITVDQYFLIVVMRECCKDMMTLPIPRSCPFPYVYVQHLFSGVSTDA